MNQVPEILCPVRKRRISSLECHVCPNRLRVQFRSEDAPELQCSLWAWSAISLLTSRI